MFPSPSLPWFELARFRRSRLTRLAVLAVAVVPLFYGALYIWANIDPTGRLDRVQAAIVNDDQRIEVTGRDGEKQPVAVGRQLAANLIGNDDRNNYDWVLTDAADARAGLADGSYKAVLTIPEDLSKAATSTSGDPDAAVQGRLDLKTNDAVNFVNGQIADRILEAAKSSLNAQVTETYLDNLYLGFTDVKGSLQDAADGAGRLADGAARLDDGAGQLADGTRRLGDGASTLADGTRQLADGAGRLDDGVGRLAGGLGQLQDRTAPLPGQAEQLADGSAQVARGTQQLSQAVQPIVDGLTQGTRDVDTGLSAVQDGLRSAAQTCRQNGGTDAQCAPFDRAAEQVGATRGQIGEVGQGAAAFGEQTQALAAGAQRVADGNRELADGVPALVGAIDQAATGADRLRDGTSQLASGADDAAAGSDRLAAGATELTTGADRLADGAGDLRSGALRLQEGLTDGSEQVPDYTRSERERLAKTAATPVTDAADRLNRVSSYGEGLAPYFMALALWVGAMSIYLLLRPVSTRAIASTAGAVRTALAGFAPGAALSVVQAVLLVGVLLGVVGIDTAQPGLLVGMALLTGLVFTAINQTFIAWFGGAGRFLAIVFVCLQLTAAGGTYPIETAPSFFGFLHSLLPMTYAVHGLRAATAGGTDGVAFDVFVLVVFALGALALTALAARRRQRVTMSTLHPTLQV